MTELATEQTNVLAEGLDMLEPKAILSVLHNSQLEAASVVANEIAVIEEAARLLAQTIANGGKLIYAAAGSSALMALADGLELPGTFGIQNEKIKILMAGGMASLSDMAGFTEDDEVQARNDIEAVGVSDKDCLICLSASGSTPYTLTALIAAKECGARTIAIANNPDTPLLNGSELGICLKTPPEVISGSTRMGAATAQKICLNMISTLMAVHLGHVYDGFMVNVHADNAKLKHRACRIVSAIADCTISAAQSHLDNAKGSVKLAILLAAGSTDIETAKEILESHGQKLRPSLLAIKRNACSNFKSV